jgi:uncharacterized membrane protein YhaH (DUF805 family)
MDLSMFTNMNGRVGRQQWWLGIIVLVVAFWVIMFILSLLFGTEVTQEVTDGGFNYSSNLSPVGTIIMIPALIAYIWGIICISGKRWHDRGKSAWWILINLIPIVGGIWALIENGFLKGTDGPNQYGPDPLAGS